MSRRKKNKKVQVTIVKLQKSHAKRKKAKCNRKRKTKCSENKKSKNTDDKNEKNNCKDDVTVTRSKLMARRYEEFHENFLDYDKILKFLEKTFKCNAGSVDLIKIGNSTQGKPIFMIVIRSTSSSSSNPKMATFIEAGLNGENAIAVSNTLYMIEHLTKNPNSVKVMDYFIVPCSNPDAYDAFIKNKQKSGSNNKCPNYCDPGKTTSKTNVRKGEPGKSRSNSPKSIKNKSKSSCCLSSREDKKDGKKSNNSDAEDSKNDCCDGSIDRSRSRSPIKKMEQRRASDSSEKSNTNSSTNEKSTTIGGYDSSNNDDMERSRSSSPINQTEQRRSSCNSISGKNNSKKEKNSPKPCSTSGEKKRQTSGGLGVKLLTSLEQKRQSSGGVDLTLSFPVVLGLNDMQRIPTSSFSEKIKQWKEHYIYQSPETTALINAIYKYQFAIKLLISLQEDGEAVCYPYGFCRSSGEETDELKDIAKKGKGAITARNFEYGSLYDIQGLSYGNLMDFLKVDKASIKYMYVIKVHKKTPRYNEKDELKQLMRYGCEIMECIKRMTCSVYKFYTNMPGNKQVETESTKPSVEKRSSF